MSLLDEAASNTTPYKLMMSEKASSKEQRKFIIQPVVLLDILKDEMSNRVIDKKSKKEFSGYRSKIKKAEWRLSGMLNFVDEAIYREQIEKTLQSMHKHIRLVQPNGQWVIMDYEVDIRPNLSNDDSIMLAVKYVDAKNEKDLKYQNGVPLVDVQVDVSGSNKELIEAIQAQGNASNDTELKELMKQFIAAFAASTTPQTKAEAQTKPDDKFEEMPSDFQE